jgi:ribosomal protein S14
MLMQNFADKIGANSITAACGEWRWQNGLLCYKSEGEREGERTKRLVILTTWLCRQQMNAWQNIAMTVGSYRCQKMLTPTTSYLGEYESLNLCRHTFRAL